MLLGVKPQVVDDVLKEIAPKLSKHALIISVAASVPTTYIEQRVRARVAVCERCPTPARLWVAG